MSSEPIVWILGAENPNADKSIPWEISDLPNFYEPDTLIINLQSLSEITLKHIHNNTIKRDTLQEQIYSRLHIGGTIIFLTAPAIFFPSKLPGKVSLAPRFSNYFLSPTVLWTSNVAESRIIKYDRDGHRFKTFLQQVKKFNFYLNYGDPGTEYRALEEYRVTDNSWNTLSFALEVNDEKASNRGRAIYLPPPTELSIGEGIDLILQVLGKTSPEEVSPSWISNQSLPGLSDINNDLRRLNDEFQGLQNKMHIVESKKQSLLNHFRLLYAKGFSLENAVYDAFKVLGVDNVFPGRTKNLEDWFFEFKTLTNFKCAVLEVKGTESRTSQANITQCDKWVSEYFSEKDVLAKGIFIPNQHRLSPYPASTNDRLHFEPNELQFATMKNICIVPSCVLFEGVKKTLKGIPPSRNTLEKLIVESKGLLTKL